MKRYGIVKSDDESSDFNYVTDSEHGNWIRYEDYEAVLKEVLIIKSYLLAWCKGDKRNLEMIEVDDPERGKWIKREDVLKILSEYLT